MNTLYDKSFEHDSCGIGAIVNIDGIKSRKIVDDALLIVEKLEHRAGKDATGTIGDGVGILLQISHKFFTEVFMKLNISLLEEREYAVGMFFFSNKENEKIQEMKLFEHLCNKNHLELLSWRTVPIDESILGSKVKDCMPCIMQCIIKKPSYVSKGLEFDRQLYLLRREFEHSSISTYVCSLSSRTIVYKGMFLVNQLRLFYIDLQSENYFSSLAIVHSRFSTNTQPSWERAHPNRFIAHNGEINTIRGNVDRMLAREETFASKYFSKEQMKNILPAVETSGSDSAMLDNTLEFLVMNGMPIELAIMICIPEPWRNDNSIENEKKDFYHYWSTMMESWDGPAAILFSDGDYIGATLDRNGLRPARYYLTNDNTLILSSEVGVLDIPEDSIIKKSRLEPGKILLIDTVNKKLINDIDLKNYYTKKFSYGEWLSQNLTKLSDVKIPNKKIPVYSQEQRDKIYRAFGWNYEDVNEMILPLAKNGIEPTASMGVDIPLAVLSNKHPPLFSYFKQLFAQVTNPPIDSLREKIVTDTAVYVGSDGNLLDEQDTNCQVLEIQNPILTGVDLLKLKSLNTSSLRSCVVSLLFYKNNSLEDAMTNLFFQIDKEFENGKNIIILSDRGVDETHVAIPSLLAVSGVEQYLIKTKKRTRISIILETADVKNVHQAAMILSYGARAINPYLAHECISELIDQKLLDKDYHSAIDDYNKGLLNGIVKIAAKMGISTIQSYQSSQIFEAVGISKDVITKYFTNTISRVGGITLKEIEQDINYYHNKAFDPLGLTVNNHLDSVGNHKLRRGKTCESHLYEPEVIIALQEATRNSDYKRFNEYSSLINNSKQAHTLRSLMDIDYSSSDEIDISQVESVEEIVKRFKTGAMSYGSISQEAHECMAIAMNHLHGKSNSGEGGERQERLGTEKNSAIKQVASGRFGVTEEYLLSAQELQIKMAQGAKPGEGGHLPGKKVYPWIAQTRYSTPGVSLISPPPHHDIYSIEDLAQLIYDLKNANQKARISVKLVSEAGVGTIASGVAKAGAQVILISGHDGGTGAAPLSSIHHAGLPWELGLAETHQTLLQNGLRNKVILETDGKLMTGRDVAIACLLGAEEFGFATAPLITMGCAMMRVCNLDTCPFGIATQNEKLRKNFKGKPEYVENFMKFIAQQLREIMAKLGYKNISQMCGHSEKLIKKIIEDNKDSKINSVDLSSLISSSSKIQIKNNLFNDDSQKAFHNFELENSIDEKILVKEFNNGAHEFNIKICSTNRTVGTILGSKIQAQFGSTLANDSYVVNCKGGAGLSFGAFIPKGLTLKLSGDANDYLGKGLSGGKIIVQTPKESKINSQENIIIGNVALYGATSGKAFINGVAGERFCVRNSGATSVVEGCGDHALEYMTGGIAVILGKTGRNVAAGMSGGIAFVYDNNHQLYKNINKEFVAMKNIEFEDDVKLLQNLLIEHHQVTNSVIAKKILDNFDNEINNFKKIIPCDYQKILESISKYNAEGFSKEQSVMKAFEEMSK